MVLRKSFLSFALCAVVGFGAAYLIVLIAVPISLLLALVVSGLLIVLLAGRGVPLPETCSEILCPVGRMRGVHRVPGCHDVDCDPHSDHPVLSVPVLPGQALLAGDGKTQFNGCG